MSEEIQPQAFVPYVVSIGIVEGHENGCYVVRTPEGKVVGIPANGEPSAASFEADLNSPPSEPEILRQTSRVVLSRLTEEEFESLTRSDDPIIQRFYAMAIAEGVLSSGDADFQTAVAYLDNLGVILEDRWSTLLSP